MIVRRGMVAYLSAVLLLGCAPTPPNIAIEQQWTDAMERMSMFAIFPLDEDVMVGDVLLDLRDVPDKQKNKSFDAFRIARAPSKMLFDELEAQAKDRIPIRRLPPKEESAAKAEADGAPTLATVTTTVTVGGATTKTTAEMRPRSPRPKPGGPPPPGRPPSPKPPRAIEIGDGRGADGGVRLQLVAMPSLTVARVYNAQLGTGGVVANIAASLGLGSAGSVALTVHLKDLQSLDLQPLAATRLLRTLLASEAPSRLPPPLLLRVLAQKWEDGAIDLCRGRFDALEAARVVVVTRVLYAGAVQYQFGRSSEFAGQLALDATAALAGRSAPSALPTLAGGAAGAPASSPAEMAARADALAAATLGAPAGSLAGGQARLTVGTFGGVALEQSFGRLLAVGAGASQQYRLEDAFRPGTDADVRGTIEVCRSLLRYARARAEPGEGSTADFEQRLRTRLAAYQADRTALIAERSLGSPRLPEPAFPAPPPALRAVPLRGRLSTN